MKCQIAFCQWCGVLFFPLAPHRHPRYCSQTCRQAAWWRQRHPVAGPFHPRIKRGLRKLAPDEYQKAYRAIPSVKARRVQQTKEWRKRNKERVAAQNKKWRDTHLEAVREKEIAKYNKKRQAEALIELLALQTLTTEKLHDNDTQPPTPEQYQGSTPS